MQGEEEAAGLARVGLFLQRDPEGYVDSVNLYAGFANDPVNLRDPTGRNVPKKIGEKVVDRVLRWLAGRGKTVCNHTAKRHAARRTISARLVSKLGNDTALAMVRKSKFLKDSTIKKLITRAVENPTREVLQRRGGRLRMVFEREFNRAIGTAGETKVRVVVEVATGKIVTAFPVHEFLTVTIVGLAAVSSATEAAAMTLTERAATCEANASSLMDWVLPIGVSRIACETDYALGYELALEIIREVEAELGMSLCQTDREVIMGGVLRGDSIDTPDAVEVN